MKRSICTLVVLALLLGLTGCGGSAGGDNAAIHSSGSAQRAPQVMEGGFMDMGAPGGMEMEAAPPAEEDTAAGTGDFSAYRKADAKIIRTASLTLETTAFSESVAALEQLVEAQGGYFEQAEVQGGGYYDANAARYGHYTVRIPSERFQTFLDQAGDVGHVVARSEQAEDVGEVYADTESRLRAQEIKRDRLLSLLEQAETMEDIIALESALVDVEYQIEQYGGALKRYDALVDFSTITIYLDEVRRISDEPGDAGGLGRRLSAALVNGMAGFGAWLGDLLVWCAYHLMGIVLFLAIAAGLFWGQRRYRRRRAAKKGAGLPAAPPSASETEQERAVERRGKEK